jgi:hypothetical protein
MKRRRKTPRPGVLGNIGQQPGGIYAAIPPKVWEQSFVAGADDPVAAAVYLETGGAMGLQELFEDNLAGNPDPVPVELPRPVERVIIQPAEQDTRVPRRRLRLTDQIQREIITMYQSGEQISEIERAYDLNRASMYALLRRHGVALRSDAPPPPTPISEEPEMPIKTRTAIVVPHDTPLPATVAPNGTTVVDAGSGRNEYTVTYEVSVTKTVTVRGDNVGQAFVAASKALQNVDGAEIIDVARS